MTVGLEVILIICIIHTNDSGSKVRLISVGCAEGKGRKAHRPHVHVVGPGAEAVFSIDQTIECLGYSGFRKHHLSKLEKLVSMYREELFEEWRRLYEKEE